MIDQSNRAGELLDRAVDGVIVEAPSLHRVLVEFRPGWSSNRLRDG